MTVNVMTVNVIAWVKIMTPKQRKLISLSSGIGAFLVAALLIGFWSDYYARRMTPEIFPSLSSVDLELPATNGETISIKDLKGAPVALFFGFTHCPEICPTTLYTLTEMTSTLGEKGKDLKVVFVTVDPERDTIPDLKLYIEAISDNAIGLSGDPETHRAIERAFRVYTQKVPLDDGDYTMDHTATVYLYDAKGRLSGTIAWGEPYEFALAKIKSVLGIKS